MSRWNTMILVLLALFSAGCGADDGIRNEPADAPGRQLGAGAKSSGLRLIAVDTVSGKPIWLASDGRTIWASIAGSAQASIQLIDAASGRMGPVVHTLPPTIEGAEIASAASRLWVLMASRGQRDQLVSLDEHLMYGRHATFPLFWYQVTYPSDTRLIGATRSAIWLVSRSGSGFILWRRDARTPSLRTFPLAGPAQPAIALTANRVFVLQRAAASSEVIKTRDGQGHVIASTARLRIVGTPQSNGLTACGNQVVGWSRDGEHAYIFVVDVADSTIRSTPLPRLSPTAAVAAIAVDPRCQHIWVSVSSDRAGVLSRFRMDTLQSSGELDAPGILGLLWSHAGLWATDLLHDAVIRVQ